MATVNKKLQVLTVSEIETISIKYLMGWHDLCKWYGFRVKGLNHRRRDLGLSALTKEWSDEYRIDYIRSHFTQNEIHAALFDYVSHHRMGDIRWTGIEVLNCRFGREYARLFKILLGSHEYRKLSELCRVSKLMETQNMRGGMGLANPIAKVHMINTNLQRYGVSNPMQRSDLSIVSPFTNSDVRKKACNTRAMKVRDAMVEFKKTGVLNEKAARISESEFIVFRDLLHKFGQDDVFYSYGIHPYDARYPFNCDFYIKSLDLFIEMNTHYSHGKHWYDSNNHDDQLRVEHLLASKSAKCHDAIHVWTETDVEKRNKARQSGIRYLVFWDGSYSQIDKKRYPRLSDFYEWFDGFNCDYERFIQAHPENTY